MKNLIFQSPLLVAAFLLPNVTQADDAKIQELLKVNTHAISLQNDKIVGPGADLILELSQDAQFVALGEEHYNFYIPSITTALFEELQNRYNFRYFMTEQDPVMMELMSRSPARGDLQQINELAQRYPMGVTFNSDEELKMLADIGRIAKTESDPIWGCDQAAGVTHILDQLALEIDDSELLSVINEKREIAAAKEHVRDFKTGFFIFDSDPSWFIELNDAVNPEPGSRAAWLLDVLINGNQVFDFYKKGDQGLVPGYYENNRFREEHLKDLCLNKYRQAAENETHPKTLMKFGSWHLFQGLSPTLIHTIGGFFANVARFNGLEFLSINFISLPDDPEASMKDLRHAWPFIKHLNPDEFAVINLRPFRHYRNRRLLEKFAGDEWLTESKRDFDRLVYGYDLLFFVGRTRSATFDTVPVAD